MAATGWKRPFADPIPLPGAGRQLVTLEDAAGDIMKLPKAEQNLGEWQAAIECLILVAEKNGPTMMARIGMMKAPCRGRVRVPPGRHRLDEPRHRLPRPRPGGPTHRWTHDRCRRRSPSGRTVRAYAAVAGGNSVAGEPTRARDCIDANSTRPKPRPRILAADAAQAINPWSAWRVERLSHRQQDAGARSAFQYGNHSCSEASSVFTRGGHNPSLVPKAELLPSISLGKASIGAGLNSLFKGIFGG